MARRAPTVLGVGDEAVTAIDVRELTKRYTSSGVEALRSVSFSVDEREIFGLLGRNGAGKSTMVRILTTLLAPTSGQALVLGIDVARQPARVRQAIGTALQEAALDDLMTGREHLLLAARLAGFRGRAAGQRADELLDVFGLSGAADRIAARYSGGMRRRLDVAMALVRDPRVLFLDEPTTGLDPQSRRAVWGLVRSLRERGTTVFLTTQYLAEADELSGRVAIVHEGRIAAVGRPQELKDRWGRTMVRLRIAEEGAEARLRRALPDDLVVRAADGWLVIAVTEGEPPVPELLERVATARLTIERLAVEAPSLEDVFVTLTGSEIESAAGGADSGVSAVRRNMGLVAPR